MSDEVKYTEKDLKDAVSKEKTRLLEKMLNARETKILDYKNTIKHTGGLLTNSMVFAYTKCFSDVLKVLTKEKQ